MARAHTKEELLIQAEKNFNKLQQLLSDLDADDLTADFHFDSEFLQKQSAAHWQRDKNVRDVLIHLSCWHQLVLDWVEKNQNNQSSNFLPENYKWNQLAQVNQLFWQQHQTTTLNQAQQALRQTHQETMNLINRFNNEELFTNGYFPWCSTSLGSYFVSATGSHYEWAFKKIKKHQQTITSQYTQK